jgi:hypothetical protein
VRAHLKTASFVPIVGLFASGAAGESATIVFTFEPDRLLKSTLIQQLQRQLARERCLDQTATAVNIHHNSKFILTCSFAEA